MSEASADDQPQSDPPPPVAGTRCLDRRLDEMTDNRDGDDDDDRRREPGGKRTPRAETKRCAFVESPDERQRADDFDPLVCIDGPEDECLRDLIDNDNGCRGDAPRLQPDSGTDDGRCTSSGCDCWRIVGSHSDWLSKNATGGTRR